MSTEPPARDPDTQPIPKIGSGERKRAALALGVLVVVAVLVVAVMIYTLGSSDNSSPKAGSTSPSGPAVTVTGGVSATKHTSPPTTPNPRRTTPAPTTSQPTGPVTCPTADRCALPTDVGNVVQALSSFRVAHGLKPVTGSVTKTAQDCVLHSGDESSCPSGYFWEPVGRSGAEVITKIAAGGSGLGWLLNPKMTRIQLGWAYVPSTKSFECVVVSSA